jgi:hypothetical protein
MAQWGRHIGHHGRDGTADGALAVRHDADQRPLESLSHRPEQDREGLWGGRQQAAGQQDFPGEAVPEAPQPLMADSGLEPLQSQDAPALGLGHALEAGGIGP